MTIEILRVEKKYYGKQLERVIVFKCTSCDNECRTTHKKMRKSTFTGKCKVCVARRKPFESLYRDFLWKAASRNINVEISYVEFLKFTEQKTCFYCNDRIPWSEYKTDQKRSKGYFLDRKNNNLPYQTSNCVVCCKDCNFTEAGRYTFEEFCLLMAGLKEIKRARRT